MKITAEANLDELAKFVSKLCEQKEQSNFPNIQDAKTDDKAKSGSIWNNSPDYCKTICSGSHAEGSSSKSNPNMHSYA